jgi:hypothetical protein
LRCQQIKAQKAKKRKPIQDSSSDDHEDDGWTMVEAGPTHGDSSTASREGRAPHVKKREGALGRRKRLIASDDEEDEEESQTAAPPLKKVPAGPTVIIVSEDEDDGRHEAELGATLGASEGGDRPPRDGGQGQKTRSGRTVKASERARQKTIAAEESDADESDAEEIDEEDSEDDEDDEEAAGHSRDRRAQGLLEDVEAIGAKLTSALDAMKDDSKKIGQPASCGGGALRLKGYQLVGLNWLRVLHETGG